EADVIDALDAVPAGTTVITVSHRLGLALRADRVVVLDRGRVVEDGRPADLLNAGGAFAALAASSRGLAEAPTPAQRSGTMSHPRRHGRHGRRVRGGVAVSSTSGRRSRTNNQTRTRTRTNG